MPWVVEGDFASGCGAAATRIDRTSPGGASEPEIGRNLYRWGCVPGAAGDPPPRHPPTTGRKLRPPKTRLRGDAADHQGGIETTSVSEDFAPRALRGLVPGCRR